MASASASASNSLMMIILLIWSDANSQNDKLRRHVNHQEVTDWLTYCRSQQPYNPQYSHNRHWRWWIHDWLATGLAFLAIVSGQNWLQSVFETATAFAFYWTRSFWYPHSIRIWLGIDLGLIWLYLDKQLVTFNGMHSDWICKWCVWDLHTHTRCGWTPLPKCSQSDIVVINASSYWVRVCVCVCLCVCVCVAMHAKQSTPHNNISTPLNDSTLPFGL